MTPSASDLSVTEAAPGRVSARVGRTAVHVTADPDGRRARVLLRTDASTMAPVLRPFLLSAGPVDARVSLVADGALLLAGDAVTVDVVVEDGASLELIEPAGMVAYDMRQGSASWDLSVRLGDRATLIWHGQPFVAASGSRTRRTTSVQLGRGARLLLRETLVLGRTGEGHGYVDAHSLVEDAEGSLLVERLVLSEASQEPGVLGPHRVLDSIIALGVDGLFNDSPLRLELERGGDLWRGLAADTHRTGLDVVWSELRETLGS